jgi:hypothetical protein
MRHLLGVRSSIPPARGSRDVSIRLHSA